VESILPDEPWLKGDMLSLEKKVDAVFLDEMEETVEWLVDGR
jgi:hypothetical protein